MFPGFADAEPGGEPVGEVWFQAPGDTSPDLLIKYLFTSQKLSVQVHPDDAQARARGLPRGKDECWTILAADEGATIAYEPVPPPLEIATGRRIMVEGPKFVLERWAGGEHAVALPEGVKAWLVPITGSVHVAGIEVGAGGCATVEGDETIVASTDADLLFAYPGTKRIGDRVQKRAAASGQREVDLSR